MKLIIGFVRKGLLLPTQKKPQQQLLEMIENSEDMSDYHARIIQSIILGLSYDEETQRKVEQLGLQIAIDSFDLIHINSEYEDIKDSHDNPRNWKQNV